MRRGGAAGSIWVEQIGEAWFFRRSGGVAAKQFGVEEKEEP